MNILERQAIELRKDIVEYIKGYLLKVNRSIIVGKGNLSYLQWDDAFTSTREDEIQVVPEVEITMITLTSEGEVRFYDAKGNDLMPGALDTEELLYVVEYLDELELNTAPETGAAE